MHSTPRANLPNQSCAIEPIFARLRRPNGKPPLAGGAFLELPTKWFQSSDSVFHVRSSALCSAGSKRTDKQYANLWRRVCKRDAICRRLHLGPLSIRCESRTVFADCFFYRRLARPRKFSCKRVTAHKQQMKHQHRQPKIVVAWRANRAAKFFGVQLGWCVEGNANSPEKVASL